MYLFLGFLFLGVGALGVVLPLLPTTPFLICSAYFFSKHSERFHQWLLNLPWAGELIKEWERTRSVSLKTKCVAISMVLISVSFSFYAIKDQGIWMQAVLVTLATIGIAVILSLKTKPKTCRLVKDEI